MGMDKKEEKPNQIDDEALVNAFTSLEGVIKGIKSLGGSKDEFYIMYPASGGTKTVDTADNNKDLELNFFDGTVLLPDNTKKKYPNLSATSEPLKSYGGRTNKKLKWLRSLVIYASEDVKVTLDEKAAQTQIYGGNTHVLVHQRFQKVIITLDRRTRLAVAVSTHPDGVRRMEQAVEVHATITSSKDDHFTGSIIQNAKEDENLTGLLSNKITITGVSLQSDQSLNYRVLLYETDGFDDTDLDKDHFVEHIELDLGGDGFQIAATNQYHFALTNLGVDYEDKDGTKELHVALQNKSATTKNAGSTGEVKLKFKYIPKG